MKYRLTPELHAQIVSSIRAGGYPHVAAEAWGVPKDVFDDWLERGNRKDARQPYRNFAREVRRAFAQARLMAEMEGFKSEPRHWLLHGPGRESEERPGWSVSVKPAESMSEAHNILEDAEAMELFRAVLAALTPFPEARSKVAEALADVAV